MPLNGNQPIYDENFVMYDSLIEAQKLVDEASRYFSTLPAEIKNQYGNSLQKFVLAVNNKDEFLVKSGLLNIPQSKPIEEDIKDLGNNDTIQPVNPVVEPVNTATTD